MLMFYAFKKLIRKYSMHIWNQHFLDSVFLVFLPKKEEMLVKEYPAYSMGRNLN